MQDLSFVPALYVQNAGEQSKHVALKLTRAKRRVVVRLTGGCGDMDSEHADGLYSLYEKAFAGFEGALLFGGTRMVRRDDLVTVVPGITEVAPRIRRTCPNAVILGVIPKTQELELTNAGLVVSSESGRDFVTIAHPDQDMCLVVQKTVDYGVKWDMEWQVCMQIMQDLREYVGWESLLVVYNGGSVTERELVATADRGWPVLIIEGSGRVADAFAKNPEFLEAHPNVFVAHNTVVSFRGHLIRLGCVVGESPDLYLAAVNH